MQNWCTLFTSSYVVRALFKPEKELTTHSNCPETEQKEFCLWKALASFTVCWKKSGPSLWNRDFLRYIYFPTYIPSTKDLEKKSKNINLGLLFNRAAATSDYLWPININLSIENCIRRPLLKNAICVNLHQCMSKYITYIDVKKRVFC